MTELMRQALTLPCGAVLRNRLAKAAMTEGLADDQLRATSRHCTLYWQWSEGGAGLLLSGNVMIDRRSLERPGNVALDPLDEYELRGEAFERLRAWSAAGTSGGNHLWLQLSHAGHQTPRYVTAHPVGPSDVQLKLGGNYARPRPLREEEILDFVQRFARAARLARDAGFTGVQIHAAHGYLISAFLSPHSNRRTDAWGGSVENRARFLIESLRATRAAVGADFPVSVKLNSDDFRKGGFSHEDCLRVVTLLNPERVDLLEISGGTYEQPRLLGFAGKPGSASASSTVLREAYFLDYARSIRGVARMPLMVTGGFRSRAGIESALASGACDVIGMGRPFCTQPDVARQLLEGRIQEAPRHEHALALSRRRWLSGASPVFLIKLVNVLGAQAWFYMQLFRLADGKAPDLKLGIVRAFAAYMADEMATARRVRRAHRGARGPSLSSAPSAPPA